MIYLFIQMSSEMWDFDKFGERAVYYGKPHGTVLY
jgi:hypothetical protein